MAHLTLHLRPHRSPGARLLVALAVLALHALLLWLRPAAPRPPASLPTPGHPPLTVRWVLATAAPMPPERPAARPPPTRPRGPAPAFKPSAPRAAPRPAEAAAPTDAGDEATAAAPAAAAAGAEPDTTPAAPSPAVLDTAATREAIRALARQPSNAERFSASSSTPSPAERLSQSISKAGKGDCAHGEFAGAGMGLLSLPFLVAAKLRGDCPQ